MSASSDGASRHPQAFDSTNRELITIRPLQMSRIRHLLVAMMVALVTAATLTASAAHAEFEILGFDADVSRADGSPEVLAGAHPHEATTYFDLSWNYDSNGHARPEGSLRNVAVNLPRGFVIDPSVTTRCDFADLSNFSCPPSSIVGRSLVIFRLVSSSSPPFPASTPFSPDFPGNLYNLKPGPNQPALFGYKDISVTILFVPEVRPNGDFGLTAKVTDASTAVPVFGARVALFGVPADHNGGVTERRPLLTNPTSCAGPVRTTIDVESWQGETDSAFSDSHLPAPNQDTLVGPEGCEDLGFDPDMTVQPTTTAADSPTGLDVELTLPQNGDPNSRATAHLKRAQVVLPEGMTVSPSAADGLGACAPAQIALESTAPPTCPDSSKIGTAEIRTSLLEDPMQGSIYLAKQNDNPFGSLLATYLVFEGPGVVIKLPGKVDANPSTGQLTATFDDNPQLPFDSIALHFKGGSRAPLSMPPTCGTKTVRWSLASHADPGNPVEGSDSFAVTSGPDGSPCPSGSAFAPGFSAGTVSPLAGVFSPFAARITRNGGKELGRVNVTLPKGLLAKLEGVQVCTAAQLASAAGKAGRVAQSAPSCPAGSQVGTTTVGAGSGSTPYYPRLPGSDVSGRVFLTEAHTGSQYHLAGANQPDYGLAFEVPAVAGPFDLGNVLVRAAIYVDPVTAQLTVLSDRLPRILQGIPLDIRDVRIDVDRPDFTINPTSCAPMQVAGDIRAQDNAAAARGSRFQVGGCRALPFKPRLAMRLTGKRQMRSQGHPGLRAVLTQGRGQANVKTAEVVLPRNVVLDTNNSADPKLLCGYEQGLKATCPASSIIGKATAVSPVLNKPLSGPVHLVQGIRIDPRTGNRRRTLPTLLVKLRGEAAIDLRAKTNVARNGLVTTFPTVPDAPVSKFSMQINGGRKGILVVTRTATRRIDLCRSKQTARVETDAQNGKISDFRITAKTPCGKSVRVKKPLRLKRPR